MASRLGMSGCVCLVVLLAAGQLQAQEAAVQARPFTLILKGNLTTSSQVSPNPAGADPVLLAQPDAGRFSLDLFFGYGAELRYRFPESNVAIGLSSDVLRTSVDRPFLPVNGIAIPAHDSFTMIPIEVTGYFVIPASTRLWDIFMGGGAGAYLGQHTVTVGTTNAEVISTKPGFGIHVLGGVGFKFTDQLALTAEMKFRDLQFESVNAFPGKTITYQGVRVAVPRNLDENIHADGMVFQLGAAFSF
jgi:opacity protein-like surface antigen